MKNLRSNSAVTVALAVVVAVLSLGGGILLTGAIAGSGKTIVTVRLWDDNVASAYKASFAAFQEEHPDITVDVTVIPWSQYWTQLDADVAAGRADDIYWLNDSSFAGFADAGQLMDIDAALGRSEKNNWDRSVVREFTRDGTLWGVPQLSDAGIAMFYNATMLADAGIDPQALDDAAWSTDAAEDTLLPLLTALTRDSQGRAASDPAFDAGAVVQYGYNAANDLQAIVLPTIGSAGGTFQDGESYSFAEAEAADAIGYLVDLVNTHHVAPPATATNVDPDYSMARFNAGQMALFQTGLYNLPYVFDGADFEWGVAYMPAGPAGRVSVTNGIVAAGNAHTPHAEATATVLKWLGSDEGNRFVGASGAAVPGVVSAQRAYFDYWTAKNVDVTKFFAVLADNAPTIMPPRSPDFAEVEAAYRPVMGDVFAARLPLRAGLQQAQDAANAAAGAE